MRLRSLVGLTLFFFSSISNARNHNIQILAYSPPGLSLSGQLLLPVQDLMKKKWKNIRFLEMDRGIAYSKRGHYIITKKPVGRKQLNDNVLRSKNNETLNYFESNRAFLVVSSSAPTEFIEELKLYKGKQVQFQEENHYWNDLTWGKLSSGVSIEGGYPVYFFNKKTWETSREWDFSVYVTYRLQIEDTVFEVTVLPKHFGGLTRTISAIKKNQKKNSIILSLGEITPPEDADESDLNLLEKMSMNMGTQYVLAGSDEIIGYNKYADFYKNQNENAKIHLLSANVFKIENDKKILAFPPFKIVEVDGKKVAIVGITAPHINDLIEKGTGRNPWLRSFSIGNPKEILENEILPKVREQADLVVVISNLNANESADYLEDIEGIDLIFQSTSRKFNFQKVHGIDLKDYHRRTPRTMLFEIEASQTNLNITDISLTDGNLRLQSRSELLDQKYNLGELNEGFSRGFIDLISTKVVALPDHRKIYQDKISPNKEEFANMAAEIMRKKTGAEVGIFNIQKQNSNLPGDLDSTIIKTWIRSNEQLVSGYLKGADLLALFEKNSELDKTSKMAFAGINSNRMINGLPVIASEYYRVATTSALSENLTKYPTFNSIEKKSLLFREKDEFFEEDPMGNQVPLVNLITDYLIVNWKVNSAAPEKERYQFYRNLYEGLQTSTDVVGYWAHEVKSLRIEYSELKTSDIASFSSVQDSRLNTTDQKTFSGNLAYSAYYRREPVLSELGIKALYSKLELRPATGAQINNILSDDLVLFANLGFPVFKVETFSWLATNMGPISELVYDSEFESDSNLPFQKSIQSFAGWKFYNGTVFRSSLISIFSENRLSDANRKNQLGANIRFEIDKPILANSSNFKSDFDYKYYFDSTDDNLEDLRTRILWNNYIDLKFSKGFSFGPFVKYASFSGKLFGSTAIQTTIGFNLNFTAFWKPKFQKDIL